MKYTFLFLIILFFINCSENEYEKKATEIKQFAMEDSIYKKGLIYFSISKEQVKSIEYPNMLLFDSIGTSISSPSCMNYIDKLVTQISNDSFHVIKNPLLKSNFNEYVNQNKIVSIDDLNTPIIESTKYSYYLC